MITISIEKLILSIVLTLILFGIIIMYIIDDLNKKHNEELEKNKEWEKEKEKELDRRFDIWKEKEQVFMEKYYKKKLEWWKHDYLAKKLDRISIKLIGNETMTIDYLDIKIQDKFLVIRDRDLNQTLINTDFIREVRYYEAGKPTGSIEDDKG